VSLYTLYSSCVSTSRDDKALCLEASGVTSSIVVFLSFMSGRNVINLFLNFCISPTTYVQLRTNCGRHEGTKVVDGASGLMQSKSISVLCFLPLFLLSKRFK